MVLQHFHDTYLVPELQKLGKKPYNHVLLFQGNDERRINIAIMSRLPILYMKSNIELKNNEKNPMFPRDCAIYSIELDKDKELLILANHFSSQGSDKTGKRRKEQSAAVSKLLNSSFVMTDYIAVMGDLNESYFTRTNLHQLTNDQRLKDVMTFPEYIDNVYFPGTYMTGTKSYKLDYILLSSKLQAMVKAVNVERRGYFTKKWKPFPSVTSSRDQAYDHHCVWVDIEI